MNAVALLLLAALNGALMVYGIVDQWPAWVCALNTFGLVACSLAFLATGGGA